MHGELRVLTWNIWFGGHQRDERCAALVAELGRRRPDVIALQEVTAPVRAAIEAAPWATAYELRDDDGRDAGYGVLVLSRRAVRGSEVLADLPTTMGRRLIAVDLEVGLTVATIHLESMAISGATRVAQLTRLQPWLAARGPDVCLVGDLNFSPADADETAALDPAFVDVWPALHPDDPGDTVESDLNTMRRDVLGKTSRKRIDRVLLRSGAWRPAAIERVGMAPIDDHGTFTSDHFGLEVTLRQA
ncbi:MAG: endonuclease/exonuclease/phosphatase family protein [Kofleriaceae bacterium]|nr:endonuclease/exonuclease/phosphatase family protein [Myxococcales bacterium]MCB9558875.1 endonuclease/exonuclease/phosphatase family protein [Kofleriaceae bacterium]MCB9570568.1 endonuclease/exonuclease/phosphatase family protein [Kofleriaceae bacterium]